MDKFKYDMNILSAKGSLRALEMSGLSYNFQDYFDRLTSFLEEWPQYLSSYNPTFLVYGEGVRASFMNDCANVRAILTQLGIPQAIHELNNLEDALRQNNVKVLSDGLIKFQATLKIAANDILSARIQDYGGAPKPLLLAVDDKQEVLATLSAAMSEHFDLVTLTGAREVRKSLELHSPAMFIINIDMPFISGFELALMIREDERFIRTPIIFLSDRAPRTHVATVMRYRYNDFIAKPIDKTLLLKKIEFFLPLP